MLRRLAFWLELESNARGTAPASPSTAWPVRMDVLGAVLGGVTQFLIHEAEFSFLKFKLACLHVSILLVLIGSSPFLETFLPLFISSLLLLSSSQNYHQTNTRPPGCLFHISQHVPLGLYPTSAFHASTEVCVFFNLIKFQFNFLNNFKLPEKLESSFKNAIYPSPRFINLHFATTAHFVCVLLGVTCRAHASLPKYLRDILLYNQLPKSGKLASMP